LKGIEDFNLEHWPSARKKEGGHKSRPRNHVAERKWQLQNLSTFLPSFVID
jgi:hypothetical protein